MVRADIERKILIGTLVSENDFEEIKKWSFPEEYDEAVKGIDQLTVYSVRVTLRKDYSGVPLFILNTGEIVDQETYLKKEK